jgi:hypothetical protein
MSIALSVALHPSKIVRICVILFAVLLLSIGIYIATLKNLSILNQSGLVALCCFAAFRCFIYNQKIARTSWRIHISGQGQLRCQSNSETDDISDTPLLNLMPGTTLWTHALFLRLHNPEQNTKLNLVVLSDALSKDEFRRLAVACKWIAAHAQEAVAEG